MNDEGAQSIKNVYLEAKILWSQIDANMHLRHSAYADFAAQARVELLTTLGMTVETMQKKWIGPILFREETVYKREVRAGDQIRVTCMLSKCRSDGSRWSFVQELYRGDGVLAAIINVDGAWIDMKVRKLTAPSPEFTELFLHHLPRTSDFVLDTI